MHCGQVGSGETMFVIHEPARESQHSFGNVSEFNQTTKDGTLCGGHSQDSDRDDDDCGVHDRSLASRNAECHASSSAS